MDWKTIGNYVLPIGLFVTVVTMFNQVNVRIDALNDRMDRTQAETNARFDAMQVENSRQHDDLNRRFDRLFEGRISHLEGRLDAQDAEPAE